MKTHWTFLVAGLQLAAACGVKSAENEVARVAASELRQSAAIALPGVEGRIDHLALDPKRMRLYIAALENDTLEVVDASKGVRERQIEGLSKPQGVLYLSEFDCVVVSNGGSGTLDVFDGETLERRHSLDVGADADNLRFDPATREVFVAVQDGAIVAVDVQTWQVARRWELPAHPESFQLSSDGARIFANVPDARAIAVIERQSESQPTIWPVAAAQKNYPLALTQDGKRLLAGCRTPPKLLEFDVESGALRAAHELSGDCDDIFLDAASSRVFVACGAGFLDVFTLNENGALRRESSLATAAGSRTCLLVPELRLLYLAVPQRGEQRAEIRVFELGK